MFTHTGPFCVNVFLTKEMQAASSRIRTNKSSNCSSTSSHSDFPADRRGGGRGGWRRRRRGELMRWRQGKEEESVEGAKREVSPSSAGSSDRRRAKEKTTQWDHARNRLVNASMIDCVCWRCCVDINKLRWVYRLGPIAPGSSSAARSSDLSTRWRQRNPEPPPPSWCERCPSLMTTDETDRHTFAVSSFLQNRSSRNKNPVSLKYAQLSHHWSRKMIPASPRTWQSAQGVQHHSSQRSVNAAQDCHFTATSHHTIQYTQFYMSTTVHYYYSK